MLMNFGNVWTTGVSDASFAKKIIVYPNPTSDQLTIDLNNSKNQKITISLKNVLGQEVFVRQKLVSINTKEVIDITAFAKGIYCLEVKNSEVTFLQKIVVE